MSMWQLDQRQWRVTFSTFALVILFAFLRPVAWEDLQFGPYRLVRLATALVIEGRSICVVA